MWKVLPMANGAGGRGSPGRLAPPGGRDGARPSHVAGAEARWGFAGVEARHPE